MRIIKSLEDAQVAIRELYGLFDKFNSKDIDLSKRRVVNASPSKEPYDYVVRKELTDSIGNTTNNVVSSGSTSVRQVYTLVFCNNGTPKVGNPTAPYYIIKRNSTLTCINIIAETPPSPGNMATFNLYCDGSLINSSPIQVLDSYSPGTILEFLIFNIVSFSVGQVISLEAILVNGISNITIELYLEEV